MLSKGGAQSTHLQSSLVHVCGGDARTLGVIKWLSGQPWELKFHLSLCTAEKRGSLRDPPQWEAQAPASLTGLSIHSCGHLMCMVMPRATFGLPCSDSGLSLGFAHLSVKPSSSFRPLFPLQNGPFSPSPLPNLPLSRLCRPLSFLFVCLCLLLVDLLGPSTGKFHSLRSQCPFLHSASMGQLNLRGREQGREEKGYGKKRV